MLESVGLGSWQLGVIGGLCILGTVIFLYKRMVMDTQFYNTGSNFTVTIHLDEWDIDADYYVIDDFLGEDTFSFWNEGSKERVSAFKVRDISGLVDNREEERGRVARQKRREGVS